jgi:hypothetical protein
MLDALARTHGTTTRVLACLPFTPRPIDKLRCAETSNQEIHFVNSVPRKSATKRHKRNTKGAVVPSDLYRSRRFVFCEICASLWLFLQKIGHKEAQKDTKGAVVSGRLLPITKTRFVNSVPFCGYFFSKKSATKRHKRTQKESVIPGRVVTDHEGLFL